MALSGCQLVKIDVYKKNKTLTSADEWFLLSFMEFQVIYTNFWFDIVELTIRLNFEQITNFILPI